MAARKKIKKIVDKSPREEAQKNIFSKFKFTESYTSLILGALVVLVIGVLFLFFAKGDRNSQTSSVKQEPTSVTTNDSKTSSTYTVKPGDDLWTISENVYKDGYKWVEIAKVNKFENPDLIHAGNKLIIPTVPAQNGTTAQKIEQTPPAQNSGIKNNSITGNTYKIKEGDNLWNISVRAYGDGYKWVELARINKVENPDLIFPDNVLKIPR